MASWLVVLILVGALVVGGMLLVALALIMARRTDVPQGETWQSSK
jgi:hypothetical protein